MVTNFVKMLVLLTYHVGRLGWIELKLFWLRVKIDWYLARNP